MANASKHPARLNSQLLAVLNVLISLFWTLLLVSPVFFFCWNHLSQRLLYLFLVLSAIPCFLPRSALRRMELITSADVFWRLGVALVNHVSQDGTLVRRVTSRANTAAGTLPGIATLASMERTTYIRERFHLVGLLFFACVTAVAASHAHIVWTALLLVTNILYNVYPVLLQQYVRLRVRRISARQSGRKLRPPVS